jgi:thioredoxin reductase (NADPH)
MFSRAARGLPHGSIEGFVMSTRHAPVAIIGSGPAGYTAAIYAARAMLKPMLIAGMQQGGQLMITTDVENYPGFADPIQGPWLMEEMRKQAEHVGTDMVNDIIVDVDMTRRPFVLKGDSGDEYTCDALVVATGAQAKWLGIDSEETYKGFGVSACATCDGFFYRGKDVVVIGGGNSAVEEALYLSNLAKSVTVIHRRNEFRSERILQERLFRKENVKVMWDHVVDEIVGVEGKKPLPPSVTGIRLAQHPHRRGERDADRRRVRRHRSCAGGEPLRRQAEAEAERLSVDRARFDRAQTCPACSPPATLPTTSTARR